MATNPILTIARNSYKEVVRDRLLYGILLVAVLVTASSFFLSTISLGQDNRVLQNVGLFSIYLFTIFICTFVTSTSLAKDLERRALYLLFPKPISRRQYLLGKYVGMLFLLLTTLAILGGLFSLGLWFLADHSLLRSALINLSYNFLEVSFLIALALLFSSFTAPLNASLYTLAFFLIGHSLTLLKTFADHQGGFIAKLVDLTYYILPNLEKFDVRHAVLYQLAIPVSSVFWSIGYWLVYTSLILILAIRVTEVREV